MSILINKNTIAICQGMTGNMGKIYSRLSLNYNKNIIAGISPNKKIKIIRHIPIYQSIKKITANHKIDATLIFVPPYNCKRAILEAIKNKIKIIICITEGIPIRDMLEIKSALQLQNKSILIGPNTPGIITVNECLLGIMPPNIFTRGNIGIVSRSGTLIYEVAQLLTKANLGQSTCVGIGGDPIIGTNFNKIIQFFEKDQKTKIIILVGEIGGNLEEQLASHLEKHITSKPIIAYIAGENAPLKKQMGHAGAVAYNKNETAANKRKALKKAGCIIVKNIYDIPNKIEEIIIQKSNFDRTLKPPKR